jgi:hypothetical protein
VNEEIEWFFKSLAETIAWCSRSDVGNDPKNSLRSIEPRDHDFYLAARDSRVLSIKMQRIEYFQKSGITNLQPTKDLQGGRLLIFEPDMTVFDGASENASQGYFDIYDVPPFDTWVWYCNEKLNIEENHTKQMPQINELPDHMGST